MEALSEYLAMPLPPYLPRGKERYNWKTTAVAEHDAIEV
jgi:hypothetical protein